MGLFDNPNFTLNHVYSMGVAITVWGYLLLFCVWRIKKAGILYEEPVLWLYGTGMRVTRVLSAIAFLVIGYFLPVRESPADLIDAMALPVGLGLGLGLWSIALLAIPLALFLRWRKKLQDVVYEPPSAAKMLLNMVLVSLGLALAVGLILGAGLALDMDVPALLERADPALLISLVLTYVVFWLTPSLIDWRDMENDRERYWVDSTGLVCFRWSLVGFLVLLDTGVLSRIPGVDILVTAPLPAWLPVALILPAAAFYAGFWMLPVRKLFAKAAEEDFLAVERLGTCRLFGAPAYFSYLSKSRIRGEKFTPERASKLCPTCLKPIDQLGDYHKLIFDACPHCGNFIPPLFNVRDYLQYQNTRLVPLIEEGNDPNRKKKTRREEEARRVQELLHTLISVAVAERGTDLHMSIEGENFVVRCRTDGVMYALCEYSNVMERPVISALKIMASLDITERRKPQDGSFKIEVLGKNVDIRVNTSPVPGGEMAAARLLYSRGEIGSLDKLGMSRRNERSLIELIRRSSGLIAVVGPTGSGKSTTLYNCLDAISTGDRNIITLEDPIEYKIEGVSQMQVNQAKGFTFATGLRSILRQDPDVIMIGEVRDGETATMAINAAATGHLVFSTLHSPDSIGAIGRLADLGIEPQRFASSTLLILSQRLIRLNCPECSEDTVMAREQLEREGLYDAPDEFFNIRVGRGCPHCRDSGYFGREGIYEFFTPDDALRTMIAEKASLPALRREARARGMRTLLEDGLTKVLLGHTTLEEVLRVAR